MIIPDGWALDPIRGQDQAVLRHPSHGYATLDFERRGFRGGWCTSGRFVGETFTRNGPKRKKYAGRGWKQALLDDAVAWLSEVSR